MRRTPDYKQRKLCTSQRQFTQIELHSGVITGLRVRLGRKETPRQKLLNPNLSKDGEFYTGVIEVPGSWVNRSVMIILKD